METLQTILLVVQVLVAISLIGLILIQHGKGADAGAAFGSGASTTVFGAQGSGNFLSRTTAVLAFIFLANSLGLAYIASQRIQTSRSLMEQPVTEVQSTATGPADVINEIPADPQQSTVSEVPADPVPVQEIGTATDVIPPVTTETPAEPVVDEAAPVDVAPADTLPVIEIEVPEVPTPVPAEQ